MPPVIDAPARVAHAAHDLQDKRPQARPGQRGFWHRVWQYVTRQRVHTLSRTPSSARSALRQMESPMARLAQEHPMLYLLGCCGIHSG